MVFSAGCVRMIGNGDGAVLPLALLNQIKENSSNYHVIASQPAGWRGNPFPFTMLLICICYQRRTDCHVAALLAMTVVDGTRMLKVDDIAQRGAVAHSALNSIRSLLMPCWWKTFSSFSGVMSARS